MGRPGKVTEAMSKQIKGLRAQGFTIRRIALHMDLADSTVFYALYGKQLVSGRSRKSREKRVFCLKCDTEFNTPVVKDIPVRRICDLCTETNKMFAGALC